MRPLPFIAIVIGVVIFIWEFRFIGSKGSLWLEFMLIAVALVIVAVEQIRHGGA